MCTVESTGNMTLSILDENDCHILKVDMLAAGTLRAGANGAILCGTLNDLSIIAEFSVNKDVITEEDFYIQVSRC